jgi:single-strand DNA-binding protein
MADQNVIAITGRLGQDSEMRFTPDGTAILSFSVGNGIYKKGAGDYNTLTTWYRCSLIGKRAESLNSMGALVKGARVGITGQHSIRTYNDKDGNERQSNEINVSELTLMDGKGDTQPAERPQAQSRPNTQPTRQPARNVPSAIERDEDLPF